MSKHHVLSFDAGIRLPYLSRNSLYHFDLGDPAVWSLKVDTNLYTSVSKGVDNLDPNIGLAISMLNFRNRPDRVQHSDNQKAYACNEIDIIPRNEMQRFCNLNGNNLSLLRNHRL